MLDVLFIRAYNKQWQEAQVQVSDLLQYEIPKGEPKPEPVSDIHE